MLLFQMSSPPPPALQKKIMNSDEFRCTGTQMFVFAACPSPTSWDMLFYGPECVSAHLNAAVCSYSCTATTAATFLCVHLCGGGGGWVWEKENEQERETAQSASQTLISDIKQKEGEQRRRKRERMSKQKWRLETRTGRQKRLERGFGESVRGEDIKAINRRGQRVNARERRRENESSGGSGKVVEDCGITFNMAADWCKGMRLFCRERERGRKREGGNGRKWTGKNRRSNFKFHLQVIKFHGPNWVCLYSGWGLQINTAHESFEYLWLFHFFII